MGKVNQFLKKNKYEKKLTILRNVYSFLHKKNFASIGKKTYFIKPIYLSGTKYIHLGSNVGIWHHARVEVIDQWNGNVLSPVLKIDNNVYIGQDLHIACAESIVIEKDVLISSGVFITDLSHVTSDYTKAVIEQDIVTKPVRICEGAFVGKDCMIMPGVTLGKHCVVGANAVVTKDVADFSIVAGVPAKVINAKPESKE